MSIRDFHPRAREQKGISTFQNILLLTLLGLTIAVQISYPLIHGDLLRYITISTTILSTLFCLYHAILHKGTPLAFSLFFITIIYAWLAEYIGITAHWPFGFYHYDPSLGIQLFKVPVIVPCAWFSIVYPIYLGTAVAVKSWKFLYAAVGVACWDLFIDPEMVSAHRWVWEKIHPSFPGESMIPASNFFGWVFAGLGLFALLFLLPQSTRKNGATFTYPYLYLWWTLVSGVIGNAFFFHHLSVALVGGIFLGGWLLPIVYRKQLGDSEF
jgi:putative membrane protein